MACYHPNLASYTPGLNGKKENVKFLGSLEKFSGYTDSQLRFKFGNNLIELPCGQCIGCRLEYSRQWATRCILEASNYEYNYFVTLTYDDESLYRNCLRRSYTVDDDTGEILSDIESISLNPDNLTKFMKDLRRHFEYTYGETGIRFFACGEYGSKRGRPHFHILLFNCNLRNLEFFGTRNGQNYFESDDIYKVWKNGLAIVGEVTFDSAAYVSRYIMKKQTGKNKSFYDDQGILPEFTRMSRMPGLARSYYDENKDKIYSLDSLVISSGYGKVLEVKPPKYYDRIFDIDNPEILSIIKEKRLSISKDNEIYRKNHTSIKDLSEYLCLSENKKLTQLKRLPRSVD